MKMSKFDVLRAGVGGDAEGYTSDHIAQRCIEVLAQ